jgi:phospholipid/cholesterol/gamma-HCH transport system substrate-binding protein
MTATSAPKRAGRVAWTERDPAMIAVVGLVLLALLLLVAGSWQRLPFVDRSTSYRAEFTDAAGLVAGEEVRVAGVKVGTVRDLRLDGDKVVAEFTVTDVRLGDRTEAGIEVKTLLGQHFLSVTPAGSGSLEEGALIPVERTSTPVNIVPAFNRLADETAKTDTAQVAQAFETLSTTLRRTAPDMEGALTGLSRLSTSVTKRDEQITQLFDKAESVTGVVAARDKELGELLTASDQVLSVLERRRETIREVISGTRDLAGQLQGLVKDNRAAIGPALRDLDRVLAVLRSNERNISRSLTYLAPYAREFTNVGGTGEWFDSSLKFPKNFAVCSTGDSTDPTGGLLDPVLSALNQQVNGSSRPCLPLGPATGSQGSARGGSR